MSWWATRDYSSQRHHCLEAARHYKAALREQERAAAAHQQAQEALKATGASVVMDGRRVEHTSVRIQLPTEAVLSSANHAVGKTWQQFCVALEECPAVKAEVFNLLGCP